MCLRGNERQGGETMGAWSKRWTWAVATLGLATVAAGAEVRLPKVISAHGVLQRDRPIHIWGWSEPGACVAVRFHAQTTEGCADRVGAWSVYLAPEKAGGPFTLEVQEKAGGAEVSIGDLLVGDVWLASGQSNMQMPLKGFGPDTPVRDGAKEIAAAAHPRLRLLLVPNKGSAYPLDDTPASWTTCTPQTAADFSAIAYFFGREISEKEDVPIGLIDTSWGGTPIESWISLGAIGRDAALMPLFLSRARFAERFAEGAPEIAAEQRETAEAKRHGKPAPHFPWHPSAEESWNPGYLFNAMIAPFTPFSVRGFLWYQGEANTDPERVALYAHEMRTMIRDWRERWGEGELPFLYAQISSFNSPGESWGQLRDEQRQVLDVRGTAMAVTLDVGAAGNVHPPDKQTVGHRLALGARAEAFGEAVEWRGPTPTSWYRDGKGARVWFAHAEGLHASSGEVRGFEVAGTDGVFHPATARIAGDSITLTSEAVPEPRTVHYAWSPATDANLVNGAGLPTSTFAERLDSR